MRHPQFSYIRNGQAAAQALLRQQRDVAASSPHLFAQGAWREETRWMEQKRDDGRVETVETTVRVRTPPRAKRIPKQSLHRMYTEHER